MRPDRRRGPGEDTTPHQGPSVEHHTDSASVHGAEVVDVAQWRRRRGICWRCGVRFADTTAEVLKRCAELAGTQVTR